MVIFLTTIIVVLLSIIYYQYKAQRNRSDNLKYAYEKLKSIIDNNSSEKLLLFTDDKELIPLLIEINNLLNFSQKIIANYSRTEIEMRKMLSNISHDLKTPLTVVLGYIETIKFHSNMASEERERLLSKVQNKTIEVLELINKFFDLAKLESGDKKVPLTRINLNEICRRNILNFYEILTSKGIDVSIDIPDDNIYILGNDEALDRILNNLISNAIKYGSDGKIIGLNLRTEDNFAYIDVWDEGKGIEEIHKDKVFERMYTLDDSRNKLYEGSGLGLTITKRFVEKLGGEIFLYSIPHKKTVFTFRIKKIDY
ncbi:MULTISPECIES: sensor histidine kinase [unclassified Clostridium]|uniref:sensor histidine kinase n=1 Tax=unclassified Clostridium TaxID=2614128 RepID=UPI0002981829|nr:MULTISPECIES: sensor histidine kinase [unclassified Clostridium]EKQ57429.1 MAG: signal transduction histidine kinase [Clostridium sp. Maddingley MBC34-26]